MTTKKTRLPLEKKIYRDCAVVYLRKCGFSFNRIAELFGKKDKRNFILIYTKYKNTYFTPWESKGKDIKIKEKIKSQTIKESIDNINK